MNRLIDYYACSLQRLWCDIKSHCIGFQGGLEPLLHEHWLFDEAFLNNKTPCKVYGKASH